MRQAIRGFLAAAVTAAFFAGVAPAARADQKDARLDDLFARLHVTTNEYEAFTLTQRIWQIWRETEDTRARRMLSRGIDAMSAKNYDEALAAFDEVIRLAPDFAEGWNKRATVYYLMDDYESSISDIFETLRLEPRHFGATSGLGLIFMQQGKEKLALGAFVKALQLNPHLDDARQHVRILKRKLGGRPI